MVKELKVGTDEILYLDINCIQVVEELKVGTDENIIKVLGYLDVNSIAVRGKIVKPILCLLYIKRYC